MSLLNQIKNIHLCFFSKPKGERTLYRAAKKLRVQSIVELGVGDTSRSQRLIKLSQRCHADAEEGPAAVKYTGVDMFEANPDADHAISLKHAHQLLKPLQATIKLIPGDPYIALSRSANSLVGTDLLIIAASQNQDSLHQAWFYLPRMLHERSLVFVEVAAGGEDEESTYKLLSRAELQDLAGRNARHIGRAA